MRKIILTLLCYLFVLTDCFSQDNVTIFNRATSEDSAAINAIALYPQNTRRNILEACAYPDALLGMAAMQKNTNAQFKGLVASYSQDKQQKFWDLTRYPGLIDALVTGGKKKKKVIKELLKNYPQDIHKTALKYGRCHYDVLSKIQSLNNQAASDFQMLAKDYPPLTQAALMELLKYPEAISLLSRNMHAAVLLGEIYKRDPVLVIQQFDSLNNVLVKQNAKELQEWQDGLAKDPEAKKEYEESARQYAREQGYSDEDLYTDPKVVVNYVYYPYPYWYGYPWWWADPRWYPYPYWYDLGFYYVPHGIVYVGMPSWYFTHWYFYNHPHHYHYPHFSSYCVGYYYGHRGSVTGVHRGVREWVHETDPRLPRNYFHDDIKRPERMREYGRFEMDYDRSRKNISRDEFLRTRTSSYPNMSPALTETPRPGDAGPQQRQKPRENPVRSNEYPPVRIPRGEERNRTVPQERRAQPSQRKPQPSQPKTAPSTPRPRQPVPQQQAPRPSQPLPKPQPTQPPR
jgi:hypothetical protein